MWCWRRLLRVSWTARRSNQSILNEISPERSLEELMLKVQFQYFGHLMPRTDSFEKTMILGKIESRRRMTRGWDGWIVSLTRWTWIWASYWSWWWTGKSGVLQSMGSQRVRHNWATELNWAILLNLQYISYQFYETLCAGISYFIAHCFIKHCKYWAFYKLMVLLHPCI